MKNEIFMGRPKTATIYPKVSNETIRQLLYTDYDDKVQIDMGDLPQEWQIDKTMERDYPELHGSCIAFKWCDQAPHVERNTCKIKPRFIGCLPWEWEFIAYVPKLMVTEAAELLLHSTGDKTEVKYDNKNDVLIKDMNYFPTTVSVDSDVCEFAWVYDKKPIRAIVPSIMVLDAVRGILKKRCPECGEKDCNKEGAHGSSMKAML